MKQLKDWHANNCTVYAGENRNCVVAYTGAKVDKTGKGIDTAQANAALIAITPWMFNTLKLLSENWPPLRDSMDSNILPSGIHAAREIIKHIENDCKYEFLIWDY